MGTFGYLLISTISLSVFYLVYLLIFKQETNFKLIRFYLLTSIVLSLVLPLNNSQISIDFTKYRSKVEAMSVVKAIEKQNNDAIIQKGNPVLNENNENISDSRSIINWFAILTKVYLIVSIILLVHIGWNIGCVLFKCCKSSKTVYDSYKLVYLEQGKNAYSFFHWIFINTKNSSQEDIDQIISHEKIHASQYHSIDIILIELLSAVMWFNPFVWMIRSTLKLVHEYLADKGVISTGVDRLQYQALLINQLTEEKLICFSSNFNSSIIKKRIIMMNSSKLKHQNKFKIWTLAPVTIALFLGVAIVNGQSKSNVDTNHNNGQFVVVIDAGHGGSDNGAETKEAYFEKNYNLSISKLLKEKEMSNPNVKIICTRENDNFLGLKERVKMMKEVNADLFIAIHVNASPEKETSGIECFASSNSNYNIKSERFSKIFITELEKLNGIKTWDEVKKANFFVLKNSYCPAVLLNIGYLTNKNDLSFITDKKNQELICDKIIDAIEKIRTN